MQKANKNPKNIPDADEIAEMADRGEAISEYFTNKFEVIPDRNDSDR